MSLFKYFPPEGGLQALKDRRIQVTPPKYFNDPFEFSPVIKCKDPVAFARKKFAEITASSDYFDRHRSEFAGIANFNAFRKAVQRRKSELLRKFEAGTIETDRNTQNEVLNLLSESFGVVCFAGDVLHPLMWAHYTESHQGMAIEFDADNPLFSGPAFLQIEYSDERVTYDASDIPDRAGVESFARRKSSSWAYEKESRLVLRLFDMVRANMPNGTRYFLPIPPELILSVTLGLRSSEALQQEVQNILEVTELRHVRLFRIFKNEQDPTFRRGLL